MLKMSAFSVVLIAFIVSVSAKLPENADNAVEARSSVSELYVESSVVNDNICNNNEKNVAFDVIVFDNNSPMQHDRSKRQAPRDNINEYKDRPRPDQKSLLIVFDATGSMHDDLEQLRAGAEEIVNELSAREDNPIYSYVLVVYRDPTVEPPFDTKNPDELLLKLKYIQTIGGGDCPEYALSGLKIALELALPNSLAYVFSDATAKDLRYYNEVLGLIQKKQVAVNFLLTGDCNDQTGPGYQVYQKLSRASNGQVYDMNKSNVKDVLLAIRHTVNYNYAALKSVDAESAGTTNTKLNIDKSISELSVSLSGKNPKLTIRDPRNETIRTGSELTLKNLKLVKIKDPVDGLWNVEAESDSSHSIRLGALSDMKFEFGFSIEEPTKISETSYQPLVAHKNVLSIFVSDPKLIKSLVDVMIILVPTNDHESSNQFSIPLKKFQDHIYVTKAFDVPRQMFKIQLNGIDANGNQIVRLISTGLQSSEGSAPELTIAVSQMEINESEKLSLNCIVKSHIPVNISWIFEGRTMSQIASNQSNALELVIKQVALSDGGLYTCDAINNIGGERKEVSIKVLSAPKVSTLPEILSLVEGSVGALECSVKGGEGRNLTYAWVDIDGKVIANNSSPSLKFTATRGHHNKSIECQVRVGDFKLSQTSSIMVEYPPKLIDSGGNVNVEVTHGGEIKLDCSTDENPKGTTDWFFTPKETQERRDMKQHQHYLTLENMNEDAEGAYECVVNNSIGEVKKSFNIVDKPKGPPKILIKRDVITVNETDSIDLVCESLNSRPIMNSTWFNENSNHYESFVSKEANQDSFKHVLRINDVDEFDGGSFECFIQNAAGSDKITFELLVQTSPKVDAILMIANEIEREVEGEVKIVENDAVQFSCLTDGFPSPAITWFKDQDELKVSEDGNIFSITKASENDAGRYQCSASNILGSSTKQFELIVNVPPKISELKETLLKVLDGQSVALKCEMSGNPQPAISWLINRRSTTENDRIRLSDDRTVLSFVSRLTDSGVYSCIGSNDYGSVFADHTVLVLSAPQILAPNDELRKVRLGDDLELLCDATGFPQPHISWSLNQTLIHNESSLTVKNIKFGDWGAYICSALNEVGMTQKVIYVSVTEAPQVTSRLDNITILTNQSQDVSCQFSGSPDPEVYWIFDDVKIIDGPNITFKSSMASGVYTCVAVNTEGKASNKLLFNAINKPSLVRDHEELKKEIKVREGDGLELLCPFDNFNSIEWNFNNEPIENIPHEQNGNKLTLLKVDRLINGGGWKCIVSNVAGNDSFAFNITVLASPIIHASWNLNDRLSEFLVTESDIDEKIFKIGEKLDLNCTAEGTPKPKVVWKKAIDIIAEGETLVIEDLQFHHSDIYTCSAENDQGTVKKFFKIDVVSPPYIGDRDIEKSHLKAIGDSVTLHCNIFGNPLPNIFWFKDNNLLDDETEPHLEIKKISLNDDGSYKCIGKNSWGREILEFTINVMDSAQILHAAEEQKIVRNENTMTLSCTAKGNPIPILSWIHNGHILSTTSKLNVVKLFKSVDDAVIYFNGYGNGITYLDPLSLKKSKDKFYSQLTKLSEKSLKLEIKFKDRSLKTAGEYKCYAYNALGKDERSVEVKVYEKPHLNEKQLVQMGSQEVLEGMPLLLSCLISGLPAPKITWFKGNHQIHDNGTIKLLNENRFLSIPETLLWNSGNYSCKGTNELGEENLDFRVFILAPPRFVDFSVVSSINGHRLQYDKFKTDQKSGSNDVMKVMKGNDVTLECFAEGSPNPLVHWVKMDFYDSSKNELLDGDENILIIRSIKESSHFKCYLNNTIGNIHRIFQVLVQFGPEFIEDHHQKEQHPSVKLHHGVNLNCKVDGSPEPTIKWNFNGTEIKADDKDFYFSDNNQILRIVDSKKHNQGKFLCIAENEFGKLERVFYVNVEVPIQWSSYGQWSTCSVSCGLGGIQYRTRICLLSNGHPATSEDYKCVGDNVDTRKCKRLPCPVNGGWGKFLKWSKCPECIDERVHDLPVLSKRFRRCDSPLPSNGGLECPGLDTEELECPVKYCTINGGWSEWSSWSSCSKTCGVSHRMRKRLCNNPVPKHNGTYCDGENVEYEECKLTPCISEHLMKSFNGEDDDELEDWSNESRDKYGEAAEFEIKNSAGVTRNYQYMNHREIEIAPTIRDSAGNKLPKIKVTLDTYKPISEETYNRHIINSKNHQQSEQTGSTSSENIEFESTEIDQPPKRKSCLRGFYFNRINDQCEDVNECLLRQQNNCDADETCINILGSFRCEKSERRLRN